MKLKPHNTGKEIEMRILEESSYKDLDVEEFRQALWKEAKSLDSWSIPNRPFANLMDEVQPRSLALFFSKGEWGEAHDIHVQIPFYLKQKGYKGLKILGPSIIGDRLSFHPFNSAQIKNGPLSTLVLESKEKEEFADLILIPAVACDVFGNRLGRGGGFYDRYIAEHPKSTVCAVIHSNCLFDELPEEFFHDGDKKVNYVLTENELIKIRNEVFQ
jgi:5,10-methenyltetrahydrofolate synthetase